MVYIRKTNYLLSMACRAFSKGARRANWEMFVGFRLSGMLRTAELFARVALEACFEPFICYSNGILQTLAVSGQL